MIRLKQAFSRRNVILLKELVRTDFKLRYQNSILGYSWSLLRPLFLFLILYIVFAKFLKLGTGIPHYPVYLLLGIVLWTFFVEITTQSLGSIVGRGDLIRKIKIPRWIIVVSTSMSGLINLLLNLIIVAVFMVVNGVHPMSSILLFPVIVLEIYLFSLGLSLWLATTYVKYRDISYIWEILTQGLFYLTPIIYSLALLPRAWMQKVILASPVAQAIQDSRYALISHQTLTLERSYGSPLLVLVPLVIVAVILVSGIIIFVTQSKFFAENI